MIKWIEATGKTEEAAVASALAKLHLERDDVSVEVLARAKSGFLGIGSTPAKVKVSYEVPDEEEQVVEPVVEKVEKSPAPAPQPVVEAAAPVAAPEETKSQAKEETPVAAPAAPEAAPVAAGTTEERISTFLTGLLQQMDSTAQPQISLGEDGSYHVELVGQSLGALIGRRGETLDAIQQLTNYAVNHGQSKRVRIHLDAENYRAKREESLQRLALKTAGKAVKNRRNVTLEPMNAYERHVIHTALQDYRDVTTYSIGTEPNRRIVVSYSKEN
jgi:spoIIIJ-associated protein